jgi:hypothetical protein
VQAAIDEAARAGANPLAEADENVTQVIEVPEGQPVETDDRA